MCLYLYSAADVLAVYNGYYRSSKVGLPRMQQCMVSPSCCSIEGYTCAITCVCVEAGLVPGSPFTLLQIQLNYVQHQLMKT